mmetsp:Transcript_5060/g.7115  ORF Transcript_5060/g.7115 Transcript_5060/m.7115 type:complete len:210 (+) Transcript_5060:388-1017(+)
MKVSGLQLLANEPSLVCTESNMLAPQCPGSKDDIVSGPSGLYRFARRSPFPSALIPPISIPRRNSELLLRLFIALFNDSSLHPKDSVSWLLHESSSKMLLLLEKHSEDGMVGRSKMLSFFLCLLTLLPGTSLLSFKSSDGFLLSSLRLSFLTSVEVSFALGVQTCEEDPFVSACILEVVSLELAASWESSFSLRAFSRSQRILSRSAIF